MNTATQIRSPERPASVSLKAVMAATGFAMALWLTLHMLGNLLVFAGPEVMNAYSVKLRDTGLLWPMRLALVAILVVHVTCAVLTTRQGWAARPLRYRKALRHHASSWGARSMRVGGVLLLAYLGYHVGQLYGVGHASYVPGDVYHNLESVLRAPLHVALYVLATAFVTLHLAHGLGSALITLGVIPGRRRRLVERALGGWVWIVTLGFAVEAVAPMLGLVG
ncbi:MAG TPA: succinate dehydrogenase cytochrome b subunit [Polyangiales bacterium]|nr:succinate dehydrogenase cytochrome b subunit [Polyangiales bacterium]